MQCLDCTAHYLANQPTKEHLLGALQLWQRRWLKVVAWSLDDLRERLKAIKSQKPRVSPSTEILKSL